MTKILISDFDNTLYTSESELENNIKSINNFINNGNIFVIATGRSYIDISKFTEKYKIQFSYLICNDGGTIFDENGNLIYRKDIPSNVVNDIYKYLEKNNLLGITYFDTGFDYVKFPNQYTNAIIIRDINKEKSINILKFIVNNYNSVHGYISDYWINITARSVTKSNGIKIISEINNYDKDNIFTIGDTINDISMIQDYNGACMKNSTNDLKSICKKTFDSVAEYIDYIKKI